MEKGHEDEEVEYMYRTRGRGVMFVREADDFGYDGHGEHICEPLGLLWQ